MYIHRVVIDANRVNARGGIAAMNKLEVYHRAGLIELLQTSTLPVEFLSAPRQRAKAAQYDVVGGTGFVYLTRGPVADAYPGTPINPSKVHEIERIVFGGNFASEAIRIRSQTDALHVDQAWQHGVDYFVTCDGAILAAAPALTAAGVKLCVCTDEHCAAALDRFFVERYGTSDVTQLELKINTEGPILIASNDTHQIQFTDIATGDELLSIGMNGGKITICTTVRDTAGAALVVVSPGEPFSFVRDGASINVMAGDSPLLLGDKCCRSFAVCANSVPVLAGTMLRSGRFLLHHALISNRFGHLALRVTKDTLMLDGVTF